MAIQSLNAHDYGDVSQRIFTSLPGVTAPTSPLPANLSAGWYDLGWLDDATGLTEQSAVTTTKKYGWQGSAVVRTVKSQASKEFVFQCLEENAVTLGLLRPASTPTTTGATAEIQSAAITGTPTGGTFTLIHPSFGSITFAYNVPTATMATTLTAAVGGTVAVAGTAGTTYNVTFPASLGNVVTMQATSAFTGGASPAIAVTVTTPGVNGTTTWDVMPYTGVNTRQFAIFLADNGPNPVHRCFYVPLGDATGTGNPVYKGSDLTVYDFTVECYVDSTGRFFREITDNPAVGSGLFL
jgi:hypothetical protein